MLTHPPSCPPLALQAAMGAKAVAAKAVRSENSENVPNNN